MNASLSNLIDAIKNHPDFDRVGMILCHNGVVRATSRDGRPVKGLTLTVDHADLEKIITKNKKRPGIIEIVVQIFDGRQLQVGDDLMHLIVAGDIRENVLKTMEDTLNAIKKTVTRKTEFFLESGD